MKDTNVTIGTIIGCIQTIIGYPLDTIKTNIQNKNNIINNIKNKNNNFKIINLYNGVKFPLISSVLNNSILFYSFSKFQHFNLYNSDNKYKHYYNGFLSGILITPTTNYFESKKVYYQSSKICNNINPFLFHFKNGFHITLIRESFGSSIYFGSYYDLHYNYNLSPFNSGGIAGCTSWLLTYPIDVIKTRYQLGNYNVISCIKYGNLFSGLSFCLFRSFLVNGISFTIYDLFL